MSDSIMQKLDAMQALTYSSSVPLGVSVARHADLLLLETRRELRKCIDTLKAVLAEHYPVGAESDCRCCPQECACGVWEYPCPTVRAIAKALGVES